MLLIFFSSFSLAEGLEFKGWSRAMVPGAPSAAIYGRFDNRSDENLTVEQISSGVAGMLMIHRSVLENGMMKMHHVNNLLVPAGESIVLEPGGLHIMLSGLKKDLLENEIFEIEIRASDGTTRSATVTVGSIGQMKAPD
jgi:copper(I)-binding protein